MMNPMSKVRHFLLAVVCIGALGVSGARAADCPISYSEFEGAIAHLDMESCPNDKPSAERGFCRLVLDSTRASIFVFHHVGNDACLVAVKPAPLKQFLYRDRKKR